MQKEEQQLNNSEPTRNPRKWQRGGGIDFTIFFFSTYVQSSCMGIFIRPALYLAAFSCTFFSFSIIFFSSGFRRFGKGGWFSRVRLGAKRLEGSLATGREGAYIWAKTYPNFSFFHFSSCQTGHGHPPSLGDKLTTVVRLATAVVDKY